MNQEGYMKHQSKEIDCLLFLQDQDLLVTIVVELVVTRHGDQAPRTGTERIEDLSSGIAPHLQQEQIEETLKHLKHL